MVEIRYGFLRPGEVVEPRRGYVYLDLGNRKEPGVVDHHFAEYQGEAFECTTSLLQAEPELVTGWIRDQDLDQPIHLCVHESPDFDCIAASYLAQALLAAKAAGRALPEGWSEWAPLLARTARRIDQGRTRIVPPAADTTASITAYLAVLGLAELAESRPGAARDNWSWMLDQGHRILARAIELALREGLADLDQLDLRNRLPEGLPVESWVDRRLRAFRNDARRLGLLPGTARAKAVDGIETIELLDRTDFTTTYQARIAFISDPESGGGFFKNLIRGGYGDEIQATCVFTTCAEDPLTGASAWMQPIISVDPESVYSLRGLGQLLEIREKEIRADQGLRRVGPPRPGYDNPDPWFDGRSFDYTIVDAPRWGTLLTPDKVRQEVLDRQRWHQHCREDIVRRTPKLLRAPLLAPEERQRLLGDLITAVISLNRGPEEKTSQPLLAKTALSELVGVLREEDSEVLEEVPELLRMHSFVVEVLATPQPALRAWVLRRITTNESWRELAVYLRTIDRPDLLLPVHLAAVGELTADERESLLRTLRGLRLTSDHARLIDAVTTFDRETPEALVELGRKLCEQAARVAGLEKSLLHLARELSSRTTAPAGLAEKVEVWAGQAELAAKAPAGDELEALWSGCLRDLALGTDDGTAGAEAADFEQVAGELELRSQTWLDQAEPAQAARRLIDFCQRRRLLSGIAEEPAWSSLSPSGRSERRTRIEAAHRQATLTLSHSLLSKLAEQYKHPSELPTATASVLEELFGRLAAIFGLETVLGRLGECEGLRLIPKVPAAAELLAHGVLAGEQPWLLWKTIDEAILPRDRKLSWRWARDPGDRELAALDRRLAEASARLRTRRGRGAPAYLVPVLCTRLLPVIRSHGRKWRDLEGLDQVEELVLEVALSPPQGEPKGEMSPKLPALCDAVRNELQHRLQPSQLLADLDSGLHRAELLHLSSRLLSRYQPDAQGDGGGTRDPSGPVNHRDAAAINLPAWFTVELTEWAMHLPIRDCRTDVARLIAIRNQLPVDVPRRRASGHAVEAVEWAAGCLETIRTGFESDESDQGGPLPSADQLRNATRAFRVRLRRRPAGGLASVISIALGDVLSYLEHKLQVLDRLEQAKDRRGFDAFDDLAVDILECDTLAWVNDEWRASRGQNTEELVELQHSISAAEDAADDEIPSAEFAASLARARWHLATRRGSPRRWRKAMEVLKATKALKSLVPAADDFQRTEAKAYQRVESVQHLDARFADRVLREVIEWLIGEYEFARARRTVEQHRPRPLGPATRFWLSSRIGALPVIFLGLFLAVRVVDWTRVLLDAVSAGVLLLTLSAAFEGWMMIRSPRLPVARPRGSPDAGRDSRRPVMLNRLLVQLFMPYSLIAVIVGVVGFAFTEELDERVAINLSEGRLALLAGAIVVIAHWAIGQFARKRGRAPSAGNIWKATVRLFTYSFFLVMFSHLLVCPLLGVEIPLENKALLVPEPPPSDDSECGKLVPEPKQNEEQTLRAELLPLRITSQLAPGLVAFYPRHLVLYAFLGMFAGIFVNVLFRGDAQSSD